ncbi:heat-shock protein [Clostridium novyi B str. ATCC 27606]|uniref:Endoribonuclease YbeY n=2 Tax=Clostridium TaxID=1485 RepID=A0AA40IU94_CLONO|nr:MULTISPECIES: rRNA maturation RNase YbeY [Clostridium]KEI13281.1 heat-shock protein [Clostridium novyi B str. NCTC 9691]KEI15056.1 heat-shock protein [Clostridium haemolyticum NCTC 9693]KEI15958.1 heat-shock protein [Clostridium novyi B str. ATCC 27606]KGN01371.1 heat-shock protein [Clostridium haemolyticum NCTC 8350]OOB76375.1 rRNA maturation RNase YbeY [Clostridium haemolyticum]
MIYIDNRQDKINIDEKILETVKEIINYTLKEEEVKVNTEVSVIFIDNNTIKEINKETRDIDKVTDVLSFPMLDYPQGKVYKDTYKDYEFDASYLDEGELVLGDIVLSLEKAEEQSTEFGHSFLREVCYLTVHSVLHLLGYDHMEEDDKVRMRKREEEILERFSITR